MNYRHSYHAGNFADVFKHLVLMAVLESLVVKQKPLFYLDTHAGRGYYDLHSQAAKKTAEYETGIHKIMQSVQEAPPLVKRYCTGVQNLGYRLYPGSPFIARQILRAHDRMVLIERHSEEAAILKKGFIGTPNARVEQKEGYAALKALLPPKERRGLIFIDPPFENAHEWSQLLEAIHVGGKKFSNGVYTIWYPIKDRVAVKRFLSSMKLFSFDSALSVECEIFPREVNLGLMGCGLFIINPPWQIELTLQETLSWAWNVLKFPGAEPIRLHPFGRSAIDFQ